MRFGQKNPLKHTRIQGRWYDQPRQKNYSAVIPFRPFFFWFVVHNSFAILMIAQRLSKNHAHSWPMHGISISNPSLLTAVPNFRGQLFLWDGIKKSHRSDNESFLGYNRFPAILLYHQRTNTRLLQTILALQPITVGSKKNHDHHQFTGEILC